MDSSLDKNKRVQVPISADVSYLLPGDRRAFEHMVSAVQCMDLIYGRQRNQGHEWSTNPSAATFDLSLGTNFYPSDLSREELERYLEAHPDWREHLLSPFTVVRRSPNGDGFRAYPYSSFYEQDLYSAHLQLKAATELVANTKFKGIFKKQGSCVCELDQ